MKRDIRKIFVILFHFIFFFPLNYIAISSFIQILIFNKNRFVLFRQTVYFRSTFPWSFAPFRLSVCLPRYMYAIISLSFFSYSCERSLFSLLFLFAFCQTIVLRHSVKTRENIREQRGKEMTRKRTWEGWWGWVGKKWRSAMEELRRKIFQSSPLGNCRVVTLREFLYLATAFHPLFFFQSLDIFFIFHLEFHEQINVENFLFWTPH